MPQRAMTDEERELTRRWLKNWERGWVAGLQALTDTDAARMWQSLSRREFFR